MIHFSARRTPVAELQDLFDDVEECSSPVALESLAFSNAKLATHFLFSP